MRHIDHHRPVIGVTGPDKGGWPSWICAAWLVRLSGGRAVRVSPSRPRSIDELDGLLIGGGADIDPSRYNETIMSTIKHESRGVRRGRRLQFLTAVVIWLARRLLSIQSTTGRQDKDRDDLEFGLLKAAVERRMPVLGICRGGQLINVYFGGRLFQDLGEFYVEKPNLRTIRPRKLVHVEEHSTLHRLLRKSNLFVNSLHSQSVKTLGEGLRVTAREMNGVIQAIEHTRLPFVLGVQWHPEFLFLQPEQRRLFRSLVDAARVVRFVQHLRPPRLQQTHGHSG